MSAVKNFIFHKYGGKYSACLQKNIHQLGSTGFYYDTDIFFALGKKTAERALRYGSRIDSIVPVGSFFMEHYWFDSHSDNPQYFKKYDIIYIGINVYQHSAINSYHSFMDDYYKSFRWLVRFSQENPDVKIGIKHHMDNRLDSKEREIIRDSSIERVDRKLNSYQVSLQSKCAVTFCSTMGYELIAHGTPTFFLDPGRRNIQILPEDDLIDEWRVLSYEDFSKKVKTLLSEDISSIANNNWDNICLNSRTVSERIHSYLTKSRFADE